ncbi:Dihydrolipoyllysine-residue acetyltransferase component of pyruvate dehydrogenase complex [Hartmannibacter diazotrophicus]|uniref:Acetyltransferase component of pyruvate dehydrogenase complex n=1 Tax=Hartmannibacter diazotrophicus TaxID=1482074 RepID=A0A2C9D4D7_9HYPH|nr:pyruvate dehydrogenase complex dihydrolipoamide acetyltransferase [Hartmannibacter diazotrophicus]SON55080.1 Dihydrolipoyllysine-residue acetyltransferase component of pyruvate dehydrogenase complex [Hartmannibacter diazotrophicus]
MPINILMPALSPTMEKGNLAKWLVKEGDTISAGDVIAEIETDKATMEVEAVDEGTIAKIVIPEGTSDVPVNDLIAILAEEGEDVSAAASGGGAAPAPKAEAAPAPAAAPEPAKAEPAPAPAPVAAGPAPSANGEARIFASPLARRVAKEKGLDLAAIAGSGPHGRIVLKDVESAKPGAKPAAAPAAAPAPAATAAPEASKVSAPPSDDAILKLFAEGSYDLVPHDSMRKVIAKRMTEARQQVPAFYITVDCMIDDLLALRAQLNKDAPEVGGKPAYKLSVNDMVIKAMAMAYKAIPDANVSWTESAMIKHRNVDIGVATVLPDRGLITPILRRTEEKTLSVISNEMKDLAKRARERKLKPEEYQGGTTAISNLGMFGVKDFTAVINPPHASILAVGAGEQRPVVKNGELAVATVMSITLTSDHRCLDGALSAELIGLIKGYIEKPMSMLV